MTGKPNTRLTSTQSDALDAYKRFEQRERRAPSVREFAAELDIVSTSNAQRLLCLFRERGLIRPARAITETRLTAKGRKAQ